jgi:hypothetical protein
MTLEEALEESKKRPDEYDVWMGDNVDRPPTRDEAFFYLGNNLRAGIDAYGHPTTEGYVIKNGAILGRGVRDVGGVHLENHDPAVKAEIARRSRT